MSAHVHLLPTPVELHESTNLDTNELNTNNKMNTAAALPLAPQGAPKVRIELLKRFCGWNAAYYLHIFERLAGPGHNSATFNVGAFLGGAYWAAARGIWGLFWFGFLIDVITVSWGLAGLYSTSQTQGVIGFFAGRIALAMLANRMYWHAFCLWREGTRSVNRFEWSRLIVVAAIGVSAFALIILQAGSYPLPEILKSFPSSRSIAFSTQRAINDGVLWMTVHWGAFFDGITYTVRLVLDYIERIGLAIPWPALTLLVSLLAWRTGGARSAVFAVAILGFLGYFGYWEKSISTMSLVVASVLICIVFGVPVGILCAKYPRMNRIANPVMDMMQTMPSMVYLLPAIAFFSIGKPPAVLATVVFAMPPVIKLTALGIRQIPENVKEAMLAFGASPMQLLIKAELPMSISSIMTGINQSIMMSLSMVVIAALIGAEGLGRDVLAALQQMDNGSGILAGVAILLCAMLLDRIVQGSNNKR